jgi:hypothetical protein
VGLGLLNGSPAKASSWTVGVFAGFGGQGIKKNAIVEDDQVAEASRSEGPMVLGLSLEKLLSDRWGLAIEHRRGFRIAPLSSGVSFTGVSGRWYYLRNASTLVDADATNYILLRTWSPYVGGAAGFAQGTIKRERNPVPVTSSSGFYVGIKVGLDYHYKPNLLLRPELNYSLTPLGTAETSGELSEFSLGVTLQMPIPFSF